MAAGIAQISAARWSAEGIGVRTDLAAAYRLFAALGWHELIYNHITAKIPGTELAVQGSGAAVTTPPRAVALKAAEQHGRLARSGTQNKLLWQAMVRWMDDLDPKYRT